MENEALTCLKNNFGKKLYIEYLNGDNKRSIEGVISNHVDNTHIGIWHARGDQLCEVGIPYQNITFIATDMLWWRDDNSENNILYNKNKEPENERSMKM